ncbi:MAG: NAD(P)/FAD-dependent oxidoreductase [Clostridium sp.]|jgi:sarcosine oxidase subunit alpha
MIKNVEILIIGGGPAGLCAAIAASSMGAKVLLCERDEVPGGQLVKQTHKFFGSEKQHAGERGIHIGMDLTDAVSSDPNIELWTDATVLGIYEDGIITVYHDNKHKKIRPQKTIVATGAAEKFLAFPGNDLPGIYGAGAVQTLMNVAGVKPAKRVVMVGAGNIGLIVSYQLLQADVDVAAVVEAAPGIGGFLVHASKIRRAGVPILTGYTIKEAYGDEVLEGVIICQVDEHFKPIPGTEQDIPCDTLCLAVGLTPLSELCWQADCKMEFIRELSGHVPLTDENLETTIPGIYAAGDVSGIEEASSAMVEGRLAGYAAAESLGYNPEMARKLKKEAADELMVLRSGPAGGKIRAGLKKVAEKGGKHLC